MFNIRKDKVNDGANTNKISESFKNIKPILSKNIFIIKEVNKKLTLASTFDYNTSELISTYRSLQQIVTVEDVSLITDIPLVHRAYKHSVRIKEGIEMFNSVIEKMDKNLSIICAEDIEQIYSLITEGYSYKWSGTTVKDFANDFVKQCSKFANYANKAQSHMNKINECLTFLIDGSAEDNISETIATIQNEVNSIFFGRSSNYTQYITDINDNIIEGISLKLEEIVKNWKSLYAKTQKYQTQNQFALML